MALIVAMGGQKGGSGKTTIACSIAAEGIHRGLRVLLVDSDPQGSATTWGNVAVDLNRPAPTIISMGREMHRPGQLEHAAEGYGLVIIDCPPRHGEIQRSALLVAHVAIIPCGPSATEAWALASSIELVTAARAIHPELGAYIVITRKQGRTALGRGARTALAAGELPILDTELGSRIAYQEALAAGQGVSTYSSGVAADELRALYDEISALKEARAHVEQQKAGRRNPKA